LHAPKDRNTVMFVREVNSSHVAIWIGTPLSEDNVYKEMVMVRRVDRDGNA
jgi:hypothetical protein